VNISGIDLHSIQALFRSLWSVFKCRKRRKLNELLFSHDLRVKSGRNYKTQSRSGSEVSTKLQLYFVQQAQWFPTFLMHYSLCTIGTFHSFRNTSIQQGGWKGSNDFFAMTQIARCGLNHNPNGVVASFQ